MCGENAGSRSAELVFFTFALFISIFLVLGLDGQQFHVDVLKKKQKTYMEMIDKRKIVLTKTKADEELKTMNEKLQHYYQDAARLKTLAGRLFLLFPIKK